MEISFRAKTSDLVKSINIAEKLSDEDLRTIGLYVKQGFDADKSERSWWEASYAMAMKMALQVAEQKTFPWPNCSNIKFPIITVAAIHFHSRAYPALIDGSQVVTYKVFGKDEDGSKQLRASRITDHQNYLLLEKTDWEVDADRALLVVPIMGCAFKKTYFDNGKKLPASVLVLPQHLVVPYYTVSLETCPRISQIFSLSPNALLTRKRRGQYLDIDYNLSYHCDIGPLEAAKQDAQKLPPTGQTDDLTPSEFVEQHTWLDLDGDNFKEPYIVTFVKETGQICRIVARYTEQDIEKNAKGQIVEITPQHYFTKIPFIPSPDGGFYDIGFGMLLSNISQSIDSALNQMFDAGTMEILGGGFVGRGVKIRRGDQTFAPYEWKPVDSPGVSLKDNIVPLPVRGPSEVLFNLLNFLVSYAERITSANEVQMGEIPNNQVKAGPAEIANANGMRIFAAIYKRIWRAHREEFSKFYHWTAVTIQQRGGGAYSSLSGEWFDLTPEDYKLPSDGILPAADPNIASKDMAIKQAATVLQTAREIPGQNVYKATIRFYKALGVPRPEEIYPDPKGPDAIPPSPDSNLIDSQAKMLTAQTKALQVKNAHLVAVGDLMRKVEESQALILKYQAEVKKLLAEAAGVAVGHNIALIQSKLAAEKQRSDELLSVIELLQKSVGENSGQVIEGESKREPGGDSISGMEEPTGNTEILPLSGGPSPENNGGLE